MCPLEIKDEQGNNLVTNYDFSDENYNYYHMNLKKQLKKYLVKTKIYNLSK